MKKLIKKQILIYLINMIIIICYYFFIYKYILNINNEVVTITTSTITVENLKLSEVPNKSIIDDFFNKFTIKSKTIDQKYFTIKNMQSFAIIKHHQDIIEKSILDTIRSDHINSLVLECESYKNKISNLEIQAYYTKMIHNSLINDLNEILKDVEK
jgi:hypothetical protein